MFALFVMFMVIMKLSADVVVEVKQFIKPTTVVAVVVTLILKEDGIRVMVLELTVSISPLIFPVAVLTTNVKGRISPNEIILDVTVEKNPFMLVPVIVLIFIGRPL